MDCFYINLDRAAERRTSLERSFRNRMGNDWKLHRFPALDGDDVRRSRIAGRLGDAEKACFLSHKQVIKRSLGNNEPILVLEDDAVFGSRTRQELEQLVRRRDPAAWDVVFTDFIVPDIASMAGLLKLRQQLTQAGNIKVLDLSTLPFAGSTAYLVNGRSKARLVSLLESATTLDVPYDLFLREQIYAKKLVAGGFFPFITSLSSHAEESAVQSAGKTAILVWNAFRKLAWIDRDLEREKPLLETIAKTLCDEEGTAFGTLFAAMVSPAYRVL
jgi:GR25 family glycosyltransferase involved in LPS biosynthesis